MKFALTPPQCLPPSLYFCLTLKSSFLHRLLPHFCKTNCIKSNMCSSMEGTEYCKKHQKSVTSEENQPNPSKFYHHFLFKAAIVIVFLFILPLFPQQAPEFVNQSLLTRSWELLHLLLVGIVISYGLFSRRNDETEKDNNNSKFDNAQSDLSRFLQVSSVFDDEAESPTVSDENKVQTWSNQHYRNEPMVVVAKENSLFNEQSSNTSRNSERPLLLPIRSLKSLVSDPDSESADSVKETSVISGSNSKPNSRRFTSNSNKTRNWEYGGIDHEELEEKLKANVVLPSPIPWRSRSGKMEMKEEIGSPPSYSLPPSMEESLASKSQVSRSSRSNSTTSSPKLSPSPPLSSPRKLSPSASSSTEFQTKNTEDLLRRKVLYKSSPPPPPPPPPRMFHKSSSLRPNSTYTGYQTKDLTRSLTNETKNMSRNRGESDLNYGADLNSRNQFDSSLMEKSVRTIRESEVVSDKKMKSKGRNKLGFDQTSFVTENMSRSSIPRTPKQSFEEFTEEEEEEEEEEEDSIEKILMQSDEETDQSEDDDVVGESLKQKNVGESTKQIMKNEESGSSNSVNDGPPDVDKKADEFIAKFREQIRLQRIESIKRSSGHLSKNLSR